MTSFNSFPLQQPNTGFNLRFGNSYNPTPPMNYNFANQLQAPTGQQYGAAFNNFNSGGVVPTNQFSGMADWNLGAQNQMSNTIGSDLQSQFAGGGSGGMTLGEGLGVANTVLGGVQALGNAWLGFQQLKLGKENLAFQKDAFNKNYANQVRTTNTALLDRQKARYAANPDAYQKPDDYLSQNKVG